MNGKIYSEIVAGAHLQISSSEQQRAERSNEWKDKITADHCCLD